MLQSIEHQAGLPIAVDLAGGTIHWSEGMAADPPSVRTFAEMRELIREPEASPSRENIYTVYRNVARREDAGAIAAAGLRYDITVIPPGAFRGVRNEFFRTAGHYHALAAGRTVAYPEVYEVISGRADWLIQRPARLPAGQAGPAGGTEAENPSVLEAVYLIEAGPGEKAVIPPGFGHISVNAGTETLVMANWISTATAYEYGPFRELHGGGYWILEGEAVAGTIEFERNPAYAAVPELAKLRPREVPEFGLLRSRPLYALAHDIGRLSFLNEPESALELLAVDRCYRRVL